MDGTDETSAWLELHRESVRPEWIDYNGHMNVAFYVLAFDHATDALLDHVGLGRAYAEGTGRSVFVVEAHVTYDREVRLGDPLAFRTRVAGADAKRLHLFHEMRHGGEGWLAATNELMLLHVDLGARRSCPFPEGPRDRLVELAARHAAAPAPARLGRRVGAPPAG